MSDCVFCSIVSGDAPANVIENGPEHLVFTPLGEQVPGHVLIVPKRHVADATTNPAVTGLIYAEAAMYAAKVAPCNIITSVGRQATQSVFHLHVHVLPRGDEDGLRRSWPWIKRDAERLV